VSVKDAREALVNLAIALLLDKKKQLTTKPVVNPAATERSQNDNEKD
jgi:hypothetical protein